MCPLPVPNKTRKFGIGGRGGGGDFSPVPRLWGWSVCPRLSFRFCFHCESHVVVLFFFSISFLQILSPPPSPSHGLCCFCEHWADSDLHCNCCAPLPPHGNLTKAPRGRQGNSKLIVRNKMFECTTILKIEVIEYGKIGF